MYYCIEYLSLAFCEDFNRMLIIDVYTLSNQIYWITNHTSTCALSYLSNAHFSVYIYFWFLHADLPSVAIIKSNSVVVFFSPFFCENLIIYIIFVYEYIYMCVRSCLDCTFFTLYFDNNKKNHFENHHLALIASIFSFWFLRWSYWSTRREKYTYTRYILLLYTYYIFSLLVSFSLDKNVFFFLHFMGYKFVLFFICLFLCFHFLFFLVHTLSSLCAEIYVCTVWSLYMHESNREILR